VIEGAGQAEDPLRACCQRTRELCDARGLALVRLPNAPANCLRLRLSGLHREWTLDVDCSWPLTTRLPEVVLREPRDLLAHVGYNGTVCVTDAVGLSLDQGRQADVVAQTVLDAVDVLEQSAADASAGRVELFNEFEGYWSGLPRRCFGRSSVDVDTSDRFVSAFVDHGRSLWYFTERSGLVPPEFAVARLAGMRGLYLALDRPVIPPSPSDELDAHFVERIVEACSPAQTALWRQLLGGSSKRQRKLLTVLVSFPRAAGGRSLVGMSFNTRGGQLDAAGATTPIMVLRHTASYMRERGGASPAVSTRHVVVLGCGSVGSEVADALASSGVGKLTLVDPDIMSEDNVFRHALGRNWIGAFKVLALREELTRKYPGLHVEVVQGEAQEWLAKAGLDTVDGVVVALGLPTLERGLARDLRKAGKAMPMVFTWLEPLDLGGHSVLMTTTGPGCLDCVYRDDEGADALTPQTAFLESGQPVTRNLTGCSSIFVPYGAIHSRRTALMAAEQVLHALNGLAEPAYAIWVGEGVEARRQGLRATAWWSRAKSTRATDATKQVFNQPCRRCRS
jgi:hypothetical protein